jgi:putative ABC transport system permease protein
MGATRGDILRQFFAESAMLTAISGTLGFTAGIGLCLAMGQIPLPEYVPAPMVSPAAVFASVLTLSLITITAGMYPAQRAAELPPVECLRYE